jgi:hypothetical protein
VSSVLVGIVDLHSIVIALRLALTLFFLLQLVLTLAFDVDAAVLGHLLFLVIVSVLVLALDASHFRVLTLLLGGRCFFGSLLIGLVGAVFFLVRNQVGLGLLRGKLGGCRGLGVPGLVARLDIVVGGMMTGTANAQYSPFDGEAGHTGLLSEDVASHPLNDRLRGGLSIELLRIVLIVDVVSNSHKLASVVGARKEHDGDAQNVGVGDASSVGGLSFEEELVDSHGDGADEKGVQFLVVLVPAVG